MSYLSEEIERQLSSSGQSVDDLVTKTGLTRSQLYLWKNGEQISINEPQLTALARALTSDLHQQAALVLAHLMDERFGPGSELIQVEISALVGKLGKRPRSRSRGELAVEWLAAERIHSAELNELLIDLARLLGAPGVVTPSGRKRLAESERQILDIVKRGRPRRKE